ncbi:hypothetical protein PMAYCL1PPCAC_11094, partial [Pristionchus mayeri]
WFVTIVISVCLVGLIANIVLIGLVITRTPKVIENYSKLVMCSAICDSIGLVCGIMVVPTEECIDNGDTTVLHFYGPCALMGEESCWINFGILELMWTATFCLLCYSFIFRLLVIKSRTPSYGSSLGVSC